MRRSTNGVRTSAGVELAMVFCDRRRRYVLRGADALLLARAHDLGRRLTHRRVMAHLRSLDLPRAA